MEAESRSTHMRIHSMGRKEFGCLFVVFFVLFLICIIVGVTGPAATQQWVAPGFTCPEGVTDFMPEVCNGVDIAANETWEGTIEDLGLFNQHVELKIQIENKLYRTRAIKTYITFVVDILQKNSTGAFVPLIMNDTHSRVVECSLDSPTCSEIVLVRIVSLKYDTYKFRISAQYYPTSNSSDFFGDVIYIIEYGHPSYSKFELSFRIVFLCISILVVLYFAYATKEIPWKNWTLEQQWTLALLLGLIGYDNPFFVINVTVGGWFLVFLDELLFVSFVSMLLFFWIIMYDGIRMDGQVKTFLGFYLIKILVVGLFWISENIVYSWFSLHRVLDPVYSTDITDNPGFVFFSVVFAVVAVAYVFYILWIIGKAYQHSRTIPLLSFRLRALGVFSGLIIIAVAVGVVFNLVGSRSTETSQFLTYLGLFNLYVYLLTYVYLPSPNSGNLHSPMDNIRLDDTKSATPHDPSEDAMDVIFLEDAMNSNM